MENKKLVKILLKDMGELEELIAEMKSNRHFDALAMDYIHTRAKGVLQVLQMLDLKEKNAQDVTQEKEEDIKESKEMPPEVTLEQEGRQSGKGIEEVSDFHPRGRRDMEAEREKDSEKPFAEEDKKGSENDGVSGSEDDMLEEDSEITPTGTRLGDSFLKGKSINDLITEQQKLEFKLSNRPVSSIQSAIGVNDRFQYIRELFDGDNEKFLDTVKTLDAMANIKDAVNYLRTRFKWKKNETSLKFVNLIKRRFLNA